MVVSIILDEELQKGFLCWKSKIWVDLKSSFQKAQELLVIHFDSVLEAGPFRNQNTEFVFFFVANQIFLAEHVLNSLNIVKHRFRLSTNDPLMVVQKQNIFHHLLYLPSKLQTSFKT